jgi:uncharacterized protein (DUF4415 family)
MPKKSGKRSEKNNRKTYAPREPETISIDQAMRFLDDARALYRGTDEPTQAISLRVPANVLRSFKTKAKLDGRKYQSVIVALMRKWVLEK